MKYRKKPVEIDAVQYTEYGKLVKGMCNSQSCFTAGNTKPHVHTIHNNQVVNLEIGDWIIPEPDGEHFYPCKPEIFEKTYEPIVETSEFDCTMHGKQTPYFDGHNWWVCKPCYDLNRGFFETAFTITPELTSTNTYK